MENSQGQCRCQKAHVPAPAPGVSDRRPRPRGALQRPHSRQPLPARYRAPPCPGGFHGPGRRPTPSSHGERRKARGSPHSSAALPRGAAAPGRGRRRRRGRALPGDTPWPAQGPAAAAHRREQPGRPRPDQRARPGSPSLTARPGGRRAAAARAGTADPPAERADPAPRPATT